jgi:hypothetical protein
MKMTTTNTAIANPPLLQVDDIRTKIVDGISYELYNVALYVAMDMLQPSAEYIRQRLCIGRKMARKLFDRFVMHGFIRRVGRRYLANRSKFTGVDYGYERESSNDNVRDVEILREIAA